MLALQEQRLNQVMFGMLVDNEGAERTTEENNQLNIDIHVQMGHLGNELFAMIANGQRSKVLPQFTRNRFQTTFPSVEGNNLERELAFHWMAQQSRVKSTRVRAPFIREWSMGLTANGASSFELRDSVLLGEYADPNHKKLTLNRLAIRPGASSIDFRVGFGNGENDWLMIQAINEAIGPDGREQLNLPRWITGKKIEPAYAGYQWSVHFLPEGDERSQWRHVIVANAMQIPAPDFIAGPNNSVYGVSAKKVPNAVSIMAGIPEQTDFPSLDLSDSLALQTTGVIATELKMLDDDLVNLGAPRRQSIFYQNP